MIVVLEDGTGLGLRRVRWRDRLAVRARTSAFDAALAAGTSPDSSVPLALHAGRLCEPAQRRLLARSVTRIVTASESPARGRLATPVCRSAVQKVRPQLAAVAGRLRPRDLSTSGGWPGCASSSPTGPDRSTNRRGPMSSAAN